MHNNPVQWARVRHRVADGESIRGVSRAEGIGRNTVRKMLRRDQPSRYVRPRRSTLVSHYERSIDAMLAEDEARPQCERRSVAAIFRSLRDHHGYGGSYDSVCRYCRSVQVPEINFVVRPAGDIGSLDSLTIVRGSISSPKSRLSANAVAHSSAAEEDIPAPWGISPPKVQLKPRIR